MVKKLKNDIITKPEKIIPTHLQHNAREWNRHHSAGNSYPYNVKIYGIGNMNQEPQLNIGSDNNFDIYIPKTRIPSIPKYKRDKLKEIFSSKNKYFYHQKGIWIGQPIFRKIGRLLDISGKTVHRYYSDIYRNKLSQIQKRCRINNLEKYRERNKQDYYSEKGQKRMKVYNKKYKEEIHQRNKKWRQENHEYDLERRKKYRTKDKEYRDNHKEEMSIYQKEYYKTTTLK